MKLSLEKIFIKSLMVLILIQVHRYFLTCYEYLRRFASLSSEASGCISLSSATPAIRWSGTTKFFVDSVSIISPSGAIGGTTCNSSFRTALVFKRISAGVGSFFITITSSPQIPWPVYANANEHITTRAVRGSSYKLHFINQYKYLCYINQ